MGKKKNSDPPQHQIINPMINPQPIPCQWLMSASPVESDDGQPMLVIQVLTFSGSNVFFLNLDEAIAIGDQISEMGKKIKFGTKLKIAKEIPSQLNNGTQK